jgi:hypothetical protein
MQRQHDYSHVDHGEEQYADSSTEVESLVGGEKQWTAGDFHHTQRSNRRILCPPLLAALRWVLVIGLQLIIIGLLARDQGLLDSTRWRGRSTSASQVGGDITGWGPHSEPTFMIQLQACMLTFSSSDTNHKIRNQPNLRTLQYFRVLQARSPTCMERTHARYFSHPSRIIYQHLLIPLIIVGMGFQQIPDPSLYHDLPTPIVWPNATVYTTSMTHQLHCLYAVVAVYSGMTSGHELEEDHHWHMIHCFDYMRQAIMCSADMSLEGLETTFPDHNGGSDGWDSKHVCKDPKAVRGWLEGVRAYDDQEIF